MTITIGVTHEPRMNAGKRINAANISNSTSNIIVESMHIQIIPGIAYKKFRSVRRDTRR
jgi:hypothetical protein